MSQDIRAYLSESMQSDLNKVLSVLEKYDAEKVIVYGSVARGDYKDESDLDICVEGLDNEYFFMALAECMMASEHSVSMTDMSNASGYFRERILRKGKTVYERNRFEKRSGIRAGESEQSV